MVDDCSIGAARVQATETFDELLLLDCAAAHHCTFCNFSADVSNMQKLFPANTQLHARVFEGAGDAVWMVQCTNTILLVMCLPV